LFLRETSTQGWSNTLYLGIHYTADGVGRFLSVRSLPRVPTAGVLNAEAGLVTRKKQIVEPTVSTTLNEPASNRTRESLERHGRQNRSESRKPSRRWRRRRRSGNEEAARTGEETAAEEGL
jgi:hypothetical protein